MLENPANYPMRAMNKMKGAAEVMKASFDWLGVSPRLRGIYGRHTPWYVGMMLAMKPFMSKKLRPRLAHDKDTAAMVPRRASI